MQGGHGVARPSGISFSVQNRNVINKQAPISKYIYISLRACRPPASAFRRPTRTHLLAHGADVVRERHISARPAPMAGQPAAPQLRNFSTNRAASGELELNGVLLRVCPLDLALLEAHAKPAVRAAGLHECLCTATKR
jgi:hypothetical protein